MNSFKLEHSSVTLSNVHPESACAGRSCPLHRRSDHPMRAFPQHYRTDIATMERICPHGVGHRDPDDIFGYPFHGCDGCCKRAAHAPDNDENSPLLPDPLEGGTPMQSYDEWRRELHNRIFHFRERSWVGDAFYEMMRALSIFSFWQTQLDSTSTWLDKERTPHPISELEDSHLLNIWGYMARQHEFLSLVWVAHAPDPAEAHSELEADWLSETPLMQALFWEVEARGLTVDPLPLLDFSDLEMGDSYNNF